MEQKRYKINEIFQSIQGEGSMVGNLCVFIRFSKCNMSCSFCDTDFNQYEEMTAQEIFQEVKDYKAKTIVFTGGEPMLQLDNELLNKFSILEYITCVETNGSISCEGLAIDHITVSPKDHARWEQKRGHDLKHLISEDSLNILPSIERDTNFNNYYVQPIDENDNELTDLNIKRCLDLIELNPNWKISLQIHKILKVK
jgi:organic radical activating enzyme